MLGPVRSRLRPGAVLALSMALASCSGGDDEASTAEPSRPPPVAAATTTTPPSFSGEENERFCAKVRTADEHVKRIEQAASPDALRDQFTLAADAVQSMVDVAPEEIEADVRVLARVYEDTVDALSNAGWDPSRYTTEARKLATPEVRAAGDRLGAYERAACGTGG